MNPAKRHMNLKQLADHLGLSQATVSRALNGYPGTSAKTRAKVLAGAEQFGYEANAIARGLATGRSGNIGLVFPVGSSLLLDPHFLEFLVGATEFGATRDMSINLSAPAPGDEIAKYSRMTRSRQADGFIVNGPTLDDPRVALLRGMNVPFILHGRCEVDLPHAWIDIDNEGAFRRAAALLIGFGHKRIALLGAPAHFTFAAHRLRGFRAAHAAQGLAADERLIFSLPMTEEVGYRLTSQAMATSPRPTAILCSSMITALGALRALGDARLSVPRDVSVIAHDDVFPYISAESMRPALTTTRSPIRLHGRRAAQLLTAIADGAADPHVHEMVEVELVARDSTGPAREPG